MRRLSRLAAATLACAGAFAHAATPFRDLHDFDGLAGGLQPFGELVTDAQGRVIGTTANGGDWQQGVIYRLTLPTTPTGPVTYEVLHSFGPGEGKSPQGGVLVGSDGLYYGTTDEGGVGGGAGTVWRFDPKTKVLSTLHRFDPTASPPDGINPLAGLAAGPNGLLYGTTSGGGALGYGTVFAISPQGDTVHYAVLHAFGGTDDGAGPNFGRLVAKGNVLYGVTDSGGDFHGLGTVYRLALAAGTWSEAVIHRFADSGTASRPADGLVMDAAGRLYGCTTGGRYAQGVIYALSPNGANPWPESEPVSFGPDPAAPTGSGCRLALEKGGRLVGSSSGGGSARLGTVFTTSTAGAPVTVVHSFGVTATQGRTPASPPLAVGGGYYVGTTLLGGAADAGTLYGLKP